MSFWHQCRVVVFLLFQIKKRSFSMKAKSALTVALAAGIASTAAASNSPTTLGPSNAKVIDVAHIYFNVATGEKVVTLLGDGQTAPADNGVSGPIWSALVGNQCSAQGFTTSFFFGVDDNSGITSLATAITNLDYGDIAANTVVDCVHINWVTDHDDVDTDLDGIGDGVPGLGGQWTYWDADNGRAINASTRLPLISFLFIDLPGDTSGTTDPNDPLNTLAGYTADIDLAATFSSSLTFEICDTDGNLQGAAFGNTDVDGNGPIGTQDRDFDGFPDSDLDANGLADWSWTVRFFQPGTADLDSDGNIDGDFADSMKTIGITFGAPAGTAVDNGDGTWTWDIDTSVVDPGTGYEDRFAIYAPPDLNGDILYAGGFWFGGMACVADANGQYNPAASFEHQFFGPDNSGPLPCPANLSQIPGGPVVLDFFDVSAFLGAFSTMDPIANFSQIPGGPVVFDFFDVSAFLAAFSAGCP